MNTMNAVPDIKLGVEQFLAASTGRLSGQRLGLLCNAASVDHNLIHSRQRIAQKFGGQLTALLSPQHGFSAEKQDNMIESDHDIDPMLQIPIFSLYSQTRIPTREMMEHLDVLLIDLQDVGTRVYTFVYTASHCLEAARDYGKKVIVLDRPNPIGGLAVEGNCLQPQWASFVGRYPIPMRHGMTMGEWLLMVNDRFGIECDLEVLAMSGWRREMLFHETGLPWVAPSPNLPTPASALVYPGQVIWEGTNVSEGRGTTQPFEIFGAPFIDPEAIFEALDKRHPGGTFLRPVAFEPTANKWQGQVCRGFQIHVIDPANYQPFRTSLALLQAVMKCHPEAFQWKPPPYEYEYQRLPMDLILGSRDIRKRLTAMEPMDTIVDGWKDELAEYDAMRRKYLLYA